MFCLCHTFKKIYFNIDNIVENKKEKGITLQYVFFYKYRILSKILPNVTRFWSWFYLSTEHQFILYIRSLYIHVQHTHLASVSSHLVIIILKYSDLIFRIPWWTYIALLSMTIFRSEVCCNEKKWTRTVNEEFY